MGLVIAVPSFLVYHHFGAPAIVAGELVDPLLLTQAQTAAFWVILITQVSYVVSARSIHDSAFRLDPLGNPWLLGGIALSVFLHALVTYVPPLAATFRLAPLPPDWWPWILATFLPAFLAIEADKAVRKAWSGRPARDR
jgi:magnesium-transporting ATPase (P-type)